MDTRTPLGRDLHSRNQAKGEARHAGRRRAQRVSTRMELDDGDQAGAADVYTSQPATG
jgi:hypothetical protein